LIDIQPYQLDFNYADYWGEFLPFALENWWPIIKAGCYTPRWFQAPTNALQQMNVGDYNAFALQIPAGSFIMAILHSLQAGFSGTFQVQITDSGIEHQFFSQPVPDSFFYKTSGRDGYVLTKPYPVTYPGNFLFERWCVTAGSCELLFAVAVPGEGVVA
jgi:hypothetical protein